MPANEALRNYLTSVQRITGAERFGRTTNEETLISLRRDVLADNSLTVLEVVSTVRRLLERGQTPPERTEEDRLVGDYEPRVLAAVAGNWRMRMRQEHHSSSVFAGLLPQAMAEQPVWTTRTLLEMSSLTSSVWQVS